MDGVVCLEYLTEENGRRNVIGAQSVTFLVCFSHILAEFYLLTLLFSLVSIFESLNDE